MDTLDTIELAARRAAQKAYEKNSFIERLISQALRDFADEIVKLKQEGQPNDQSRT